MNRQDLAKEFGQLFILAIDGPCLSAEMEEFIKTFRVGGLIFFADNFESPAQFTSLVQDIQRRCHADGTPLFIATDHEGGKRQELVEGFTKIPPMFTMGIKDPAETKELYRQMGRELRKVQVNLNFAPVADLCAPNTPGSIGERSFGTDPYLVSKHVIAAIEGLQAEGVLACVKHFPGHGATTKNSAHELPSIDLTWDQLQQSDLVPFEMAIRLGVAAVMTAHVVYKEAGDEHWPASLSGFWITEVLRNRLGFNGVIISDALEMKALTNYWNPVESGIKAFESGTNILLYYREKNQFEAFYQLRQAVERGEIDQEHLSKSISKVRNMKSKIHWYAH